MAAWEALVLSLCDAGCVKFGSFKLKTGILSPVYFDLRTIVSFPELMCQVSQCLWEKVTEKRDKFTTICGVPYTALPFASVISTNHSVSMVMRRKEVKDYGTKKVIEGKIVEGSNCLIVEDVVTSGSSIMETAVELEKVGLIVTDAVVLLNREQGGKENLADRNITLHSVVTMTDVVQVLAKHNKITDQVRDDVVRFIRSTPAVPLISSVDKKLFDVSKMTFEERSHVATHPLSKRLFEIMMTKKTNLCLSADMTTTAELMKLCDEVGPHVCMVKMHVDIVEDFKLESWMELRKLADKHNFLIIEDRKFADIGNTVKHQASGGVYHVTEWADLVTVHGISGEGILKAFNELAAAEKHGRTIGCILLAEMSSEGNLITQDYTKSILSMSENHKDCVAGLVCTKRVSTDPGCIAMAPGVQLCVGGDGLGQTYNTPQEVVGVRGSDIIIVGRGIYKVSVGSPVENAIKFKESGFTAYMSRVGKDDQSKPVTNDHVSKAFSSLL